MVAHNLVLHATTKHIKLDIHFVRERVTTRKLSIHHVLGTTQITYALKFITFEYKHNFSTQIYYSSIHFTFNLFLSKINSLKIIFFPANQAHDKC